MASNVLPFPSQPSNDNDDDLPPSPQAACLLAMVYMRLGGSFSIGSNGRSYLGRPEPCLLRTLRQDLPSLPNSEPHELFADPKEWQGAMKLVEALLNRLCEADSAYVFDLFATVAVDERKFTASIDEPLRRAA